MDDRKSYADAGSEPSHTLPDEWGHYRQLHRDIQWGWYAINVKRTIINLIEVAPDQAHLFDAHYVGDNVFAIGDTYPDTDLTPPREPTEQEKIRADIDFLAVMTGVEL